MLQVRILHLVFLFFISSFFYTIAAKEQKSLAQRFAWKCADTHRTNFIPRKYPEAILSFDELLSHTPGTKNIEQLYLKVPKKYDFFKTWNALFGSFALSRKITTKDYPRTVFFQGNLISASVDNPNIPTKYKHNNANAEIFEMIPSTYTYVVNDPSGKMIQKQDTYYTYQLNLIDYSKGKALVKQNVDSCRRCHGKDPRPIWKTYRDWPGMFIEQETFLDEYRKQHSFYAHMDYRYRFSDASFNRYLNYFAYQRMAHDMRRTPLYNVLKYAALAGLFNCDDIPSFLGQGKLRKFHDSASPEGIETYKKEVYAAAIKDKEQRLKMREFINDTRREGMFDYGKVVVDRTAALIYLFTPWGVDMKKYAPTFSPGENTYSYGMSDLGAGANSVRNLMCNLTPDVVHNDKSIEFLYKNEPYQTTNQPKTCSALKDLSLKAVKSWEQKSVVQELSLANINSQRPIELQRPIRYAHFKHYCVSCHAEDAGAFAPTIGLNSESDFMDYIQMNGQVVYEMLVKDRQMPPSDEVEAHELPPADLSHEMAEFARRNSLVNRRDK